MMQQLTNLHGKLKTYTELSQLYLLKLQRVRLQQAIQPPMMLH